MFTFPKKSSNLSQENLISLNFLLLLSEKNFTLEWRCATTDEIERKVSIYKILSNKIHSTAQHAID